MEQLNDSTVVVKSHDDLNKALSLNNGYTHVYLGENIAITSRIIVNSAKTAITIDGFYPPDETGEYHLLSHPTGNERQIYVNTGGNMDITFQNMKIEGRNYFGILRVLDSVTTANVRATFRNVTYKGPQLIWHPWGTTNIYDCNITIKEDASEAHEVGEVNRLVIGGKTSIQHESLTKSVFLMYKTNASFTLLDDAELDVVTNRSFVQRETNLPFTIGKRAKFTLTTARAFAFDDGHYLGNFLVDENAVFRYIRTSNRGGTYAINLDGSFTVNKGANVYLQAAYPGDGTLLRFISTSGGLYLNNPKSFVLYKAGTGLAARAMYFYYPTKYEFHGGQVNYWLNAEPLATAGNFEDVAPGRWYRPNWDSFMLKGVSTDGGTTISERTITDEELKNLAPLSMMNLRNARVLSVGDVLLEVNPIVDDGRPITGTSEPMAKIRMEHKPEGASHLYTGEANEQGEYILQPTQPMVIGEDVLASANTPFLIVSLKRKVVGIGEIGFRYVPDTISFQPIPVTITPNTLLKRKTLATGEQDPIIIFDTRVDRTPWELWARITRECQSDDGKYKLKDAVVFALEDGSLITLSDENTRIYQTNPTPYEIVEKNIVWPENQGILAQIIGKRRCCQYLTDIIWELRAVESID